MRYSGFRVLTEALRGHKGWRPAWRDPAPQPAHDDLIVGGGGHGLATAYYLAKEFGHTRIAVPEKGWIGGGRLGLRSIDLRQDNGAIRTFWCDALAVSGGWNPNLAVTVRHRGRPVWSDALAAFVPGPGTPPGLTVAGAAAGAFSTDAALRGGAAAARAALSDLGRTAPPDDLPRAEDAPVWISAIWHVAGKGCAFNDQQNDVTVKDVVLAAR